MDIIFLCECDFLFYWHESFSKDLSNKKSAFNDKFSLIVSNKEENVTSTANGFLNDSDKENTVKMKNERKPH